MPLETIALYVVFLTFFGVLSARPDCEVEFEIWNITFRGAMAGLAMGAVTATMANVTVILARTVSGA